jgi:hypothetical protein
MCDLKIDLQQAITDHPLNESFAMTRLALKPFPQYEGLAEMAMMMLRIQPAQQLIKQPPEMNALSEISIEDWDKLFHAVEDRLCTSVAASLQADDKTRVTVLECVEALDQLHSALTRERQLRYRPQ